MASETDLQAQDQPRDTALRGFWSKVRTAVTGNKAWLARTSTPTNAQAVDQIDRLTRQVNTLIKLEINDLSDPDGT